MYAVAQQNMIHQQLRTSGVVDEKILALYEAIPRDQFVPSAYADAAYSDMQIPLPHGETMMTPSEEGIILQTLQLTGTENVLEVGTGSGFLTALLSRLCQQLMSIDIHPDFVKAAHAKLQTHHCQNTTIFQGNAFHGWPSRAPYDCIVITGALPQLHDTLLAQLAPGGRMVAIVGKPPVMQAQLHQLHPDNTWHTHMLFNTYVPMLLSDSPPTTFTF